MSIRQRYRLKRGISEQSIDLIATLLQQLARAWFAPNTPDARAISHAYDKPGSFLQLNFAIFCGGFFHLYFQNTMQSHYNLAHFLDSKKVSVFWISEFFFKACFPSLLSTCRSRLLLVSSKVGHERRNKLRNFGVDRRLQ